jgi:hypothetical protein
LGSRDAIVKVSSQSSAGEDRGEDTEERIQRRGYRGVRNTEERIQRSEKYRGEDTEE